MNSNYLSSSLACCASGGGDRTGRSRRGGGGVSISTCGLADRHVVLGIVWLSIYQVVGLEIEATGADDQSSFRPTTRVRRGANGGLPLDLPPVFDNAKGRAVIFFNNVRVTSTTSDRLEPFFVAGGGIASIRHEADLLLFFRRQSSPSAAVPEGAHQGQTTQRLSSSSVGMALTLGDGWPCEPPRLCGSTRTCDCSGFLATPTRTSAASALASGTGSSRVPPSG